MVLTDHKILALKEGAHHDGGCSGLQVRVGKNRTTFYASLRINGKKVMKKLGSPPKMNISEARSLVHRIRAGDQISSPENKADAKTVSNILNEFIERHIPTVSERTGKDYQKAIDYFAPLLGDLPVTDVDQYLAQRIYDQLPGNGAMANRHLAAIRKAWNLLVDDRNPWERVIRRKEKPREQFSTAEELKRLMDVVEKQKDPDTKAIYILILMTACRRGEAQAMNWDDLDGNIWHKPKTKNGKGHRVVVPQKALDAIKALPNREGKVFHHSGFSNSWKRLKKDAKIRDDLNIHDLRRSIAIELLKSRKVTIKDISNLLGHSSVSITERVYAPYLGDNREAVVATEDIFKKLEKQPMLPTS
jgi:integrase